MRLDLRPFPNSPASDLRLAVEIARAGARLSLAYALTGDIGALRIPAKTAPARADELWRRTCFEAFVGGPGEAYCEFNAAPSTQWAAYAFSGYRREMRKLELAADPEIDVSAAADLLDVRVGLDLSRVPELTGAAWRVGLSAVLENESGAMSYWALSHAPGRPDFHHPNSFSLELAAASRP